MMDRNECDLLMERHRRLAARADATGSRQPAPRPRRTVREVIAWALVALAARLAPSATWPALDVRPIERKEAPHG